MTFQELRHPQCRGVAVVDPNRQRLKAFQQHPGVEWAQGRPGVAHQRLHRTVDVLLIAQDRPAEDAALAVDVLGAGVDHHVDAQWQALLQQRSGEDVVQQHLCPGGMRHLGYRRDIDQGLHRVRRRLKEDRRRGFAQRLLPLVKVGAVDEDGLHPPARQDLVAHHEAGTEKAAAGHQSVTRAQQCAQSGEYRGHSRGRREACLGALDQTQSLLEHRDGGISVAGVDEPVDLTGEGFLRLGGRVVDIPRRQIQRFGGLVKTGAQQAAAHTDGLLAHAVRQWRRDSHRGHAVVIGGHDCFQGSPSARHPVPPRWPCASS